MEIEKAIRFAQSLDQSRESIDKLYDYLLSYFCLEKPSENRSQKNGVLITFDGHSGTGKDTQIKSLVEEIKKEGLFSRYNLVQLIQKRNDPFRQIPKYLWAHPEISTSGNSNNCSFLLLTAGRRYFVYDMLLPELQDPDAIVLLNRSYLSHIAYHASDEKELSDLLNLADFDPKPDLSFVLECDVGIAYERVIKRSPEKGGKIYSNEQPIYIARVKKNFRGLKKFVDDLIFIDTSGESNQISQEIEDYVQKYFSKEGLI